MYGLSEVGNQLATAINYRLMQEKQLEAKEDLAERVG
jgi:hypothetical protein